MYVYVFYLMDKAEMAIPQLFKCPISLDLFKDPVTLSTGQTYERSSIEKWFATGHLICPVTMQKLHHPSMVPNLTLRHLIHEWLLNHHHRFSTMDPNFSLAVIRQKLESDQVSLKNKLQVLGEIEALIKEQPENSYCLIKLGLFKLLLQVVFGKVEESLQLVEKSLVCAMELLPFSDIRSLDMLKEQSRLSRFVELFHRGNLVIKKSLCQLVEAISSSLYTKDLCIAIAKKQSFLQEVVSLILDDDSNASESAIKSVSALCSSEQNKENVVQAGTIQGLVTYILRAKMHEYPMALKAMTTVEILLGLESARLAILNDSNGVKALVKMVFRVSNDHECSEIALNSLMILCNDSFWAREEVICAGVLTQLLLLLQSQCDERTKTKARMLLRLLRSEG